jgi:hypothetical protein
VWVRRRAEAIRIGRLLMNGPGVPGRRRADEDRLDPRPTRGSSQPRRPLPDDAGHLDEDVLRAGAGTLEDFVAMVGRVHGVERHAAAELLADRPQEVQLRQIVARAAELGCRLPPPRASGRAPVGASHAEPGSRERVTLSRLLSSVPGGEVRRFGVEPTSPTLDGLKRAVAARRRFSGPTFAPHRWAGELIHVLRPSRYVRTRHPTRGSRPLRANRSSRAASRSMSRRPWNFSSG